MKMFFKILRISLITVALLPGFRELSAQTQSDLDVGNDEGVVIYSLPNTSITLEAEVVKEIYTAGPYSKFAQKYLGVEADEADGVKYELLSVTVNQNVEADQSHRFIANLSALKGAAASNFMKMTSQGLIVFSDNSSSGESRWRFPSQIINKNESTDGITSNLTNTETILYKNEKRSTGYERIAITQTQTVQKSLEKKAQETADAIFSLRRAKTEIITGDTDATFSGEALKAAIDEINRLEQEYVALFLGRKEYSTEKASFDVVPDPKNTNQIYIAFRLSDTQGLLPSNNVSGRPIVMELAVENKGAESGQLIQNSSQSRDRATAKKAKTDADVIYYRVPATCSLKLLDGTRQLLQSRILVYQLGEVFSFPTDVIVK